MKQSLLVGLSRSLYFWFLYICVLQEAFPPHTNYILDFLSCGQNIVATSRQECFLTKSILMSSSFSMSMSKRQNWLLMPFGSSYSFTDEKIQKGLYKCIALVGSPSPIEAFPLIGESLGAFCESCFVDSSSIFTFTCVHPDSPDSLESPESPDCPESQYSPESPDSPESSESTD